jgi:hypothetical protein
MNVGTKGSIIDTVLTTALNTRRLLNMGDPVIIGGDVSAEEDKRHLERLKGMLSSR